MELMTEEKKGFKKTDVGLIPKDWEVKNLTEVGEILSGLTYKPSDVADFGTLVLRSSNIQDGALAYQDNVFVDMEVPNKVIVKEGDILICVRNGSKRLIGKCAMIDENAEGSAFGAFMSIIRSDNSQLVFYLFQSEMIQEQIQESLGATINQITNRDFKRFIIPFPPTLAEQQAIATALSDVDELIRSLDRLIQKKEAIKKGTMQQLLTGKKRLPGFGGEWEVKALRELIEKIVGGGTPSRSKDEYWGGEIPWATVKDFRTFHENGTQERITKEGLMNSSSNLIPKGTVITSTRMGLGQAVIYDVDVAINQDLKAIFTNKKLIPEYLFYWFSANKEEIESLGSGSTVKGISLGDLKSFETYISDSIEEQKAIAQILSDMDREIQVLRQKREKVGQIKQGMMEELLTGKTRLVKD